MKEATWQGSPLSRPVVSPVFRHKLRRYKLWSDRLERSVERRKKLLADGASPQALAANLYGLQLAKRERADLLVWLKVRLLLNDIWQS